MEDGGDVRARIPRYLYGCERCGSGSMRSLDEMVTAMSLARPIVAHACDGLEADGYIESVFPQVLTYTGNPSYRMTMKGKLFLLAMARSHPPLDAIAGRG